MENATISIEEHKKGKLIGELNFEDGKGMSVPSKFIVSSDMNDKVCKVERVGGRPIKIVVDGKELKTKEKQFSHSTRNNYNNKSGSYNRSASDKYSKPAQAHNLDIFTASAPYNFVPLNKKIVTQEKPCSFDKYIGNTGYIDLEIEAKTPIYIRGVVKENGEENSDFYKQAGKYRIPGSSLRGMIRTMVEMVSWSKFGSSMLNDNENKKIKYFYRKLMDKSKDLENDYKRFIAGGNSNIGYYNKVLSGYLYRRGVNDYYIKPAITTIAGNYFFRVEDDLVAGAKLNKNISVQYRNSKGNLGYESNPDYKEKVEHVYITYDKTMVHTNHTVPMRYANVTSIRQYNGHKHDYETEGYLICSGYVPSRKKGKHLHWIIPIEDINAKPIKVSEDLIYNYNNDFDSTISSKRNKTPSSRTDIRKIKNDTPSPCFYIVSNHGDVISFGHTGHFRIPYKNVIPDFLPENHKSSNTDIAKSIFGNKKDFMTRVFFEDTFLYKDNYDKVSTQAKIPQTLLGPKPTSFQLYLEQKKNDIKPIYNKKNGRLIGWEGIKSYNDQTQIRGNKFYWHKMPSNIWKDKNDFKLDIDTKIQPIDKGTKFNGRIRFENLSDIELGALLFAIDLPQGLAHKIGMAKPLGLGSIRINSKLYLSDRKNRYKNLFAEWSGLKNKSESINKLKSAFENYIIEKIGEKKGSLWETDRLKELRKMLDFEHKPNAISTKYMELERFPKREILPKPSEVQ